MRPAALIATVVSLSVSAVLAAAPAPASAQKGAALMFAKGSGTLTEAEKMEMFKATGLIVSKDGKGFVDEVCGQTAGADVEIRDMNADKVPEVLIIYGNDCLAGNTGSNVLLFIKDASGKYKANLGFPGASADPLPQKSMGYPDLQIGGPGFCFPVWRWNGKEYAGHHNQPQEPGGCDNN